MLLNVRLSFLLPALLMMPGCTPNADMDPASGESRKAASGRPINSVNMIVNDMKLCHQALPHGVPTSFDWQRCPRVGGGPENMQAMLPWGQVYESVNGNPATNTRVQLRNLKVYYLSRSTRKWIYVTGSQLVDGAAYREDFSENYSRPADKRNEPDGTLSVRAGDGYNFHFWSVNGRATINPQDIEGVFSTCQARLILDDASKPDDRATARYLLSIGADYWKNLTTDWCPDWTCNYDAGIGRFRFVGNNWQAFNMHTLSEAALRRNPPPLE